VGLVSVVGGIVWKYLGNREDIESVWDSLLYMREEKMVVLAA
jgi:hypothetical protein